MIAMKFGGTSVQDASAIRRIVGIIRDRLSRRPVVLISAMGKTTKNLLECASLAAAGNRQSALGKLEAIRSYHESVANQSVLDWSRTEGSRRIESYFGEMRKLLDGLSILRELSARSQDKMLSYGELISTSIIQEVLVQNHIPAVWLDSRKMVITDEQFTAASPLQGETNDAVQKQVRPIVENGQIPVLQGYIGSSRNGATTTLGFEGSDYSAALVGLALGVSEIQIWKDVSGVMTADPEMVPDARTVKAISFDEANELTFYGAKVLHSKSIEPARLGNIPVSVCNSKEPERTGTWIFEADPSEKNAVKSIAYKKPVILMRIQSNRSLSTGEFYHLAADAFLREYAVPLAFGTSENTVVALLSGQTVSSVIRNRLTQFASVACRENRASVSLIGKNIAFRRNILQDVSSILKDVSLDWVSWGVSENSFTFVIHENDLKPVLNSLHSVFFREWDPTLFC